MHPLEMSPEFWCASTNSRKAVFGPMKASELRHENDIWPKDCPVPAPAQ